MAMFHAMKTAAFLRLIAGAATASALQSLPTPSAHWLADPLRWQIDAAGRVVARTHDAGFAIFDTAPLASNLTVSAVVTPRAATGSGWRVTGLVAYESGDDYWQFALVEAPPDRGGRRSFELGQKLAGRWPVGDRLDRNLNEGATNSWSDGVSYRLTLSIDSTSVNATAVSPEGTVLRRVRYYLSTNSPAVLRVRPAVRADGIAAEFRDVRAAWADPAEEPRPVFPPFTATSATATNVQGPATGFVRVHRQPDGRWWAIDPLGRGMVVLGVDHVTFRGSMCEALGYAPHGRKNEGRYPDRRVWEAETLNRLRSWGFNALGAGCDPALYRRGLFHSINLNIGVSFAAAGGDCALAPHERRPSTAFPNVFHPDFAAYAAYRARRDCRPNRGDPWLLGYYLDNELAWWGRGATDTGLFDMAMALPANHSAKQAVCAFLANYATNNLVAFNQTWGLALSSWDELARMTALPSDSDVRRAAKAAFLRRIAELYFSTLAGAVRAADPDHMILGARFAGRRGADPVVWEVAGRHCEIVAFNFYPTADLNVNRVFTQPGPAGEPVEDHFARNHALAGRPLLVTEWSFPALDSGLPCLHGAGQRFLTQGERARASELFARTMLSLPFLVGYNYFMWVDEPALGISAAFPEDSNYGLINEDGVPYRELTEMFAALHREAPALRFAPPPGPRIVPRRRLPSADAAAAAAAHRAPGESAHFILDGESFRLENRRLRIAGAIGGGPVVRTATLDDRPEPFGTFTPLLHVADEAGRSRWVEAALVASARGGETGGVAVATVEAAAQVPGAARSRLEITCRLLLPPAAPWFLIDIVRVRNLGSHPLTLRAVFFKFEPAFNGRPPRLPPNLWGRPPSACWMEPGGGRFWGVAGRRESELLAQFAIDEARGTRHSSARYEVNTSLPAGGTFEPPSPMYAAGIAGIGDVRAWIEAAIGAVRDK